MSTGSTPRVGIGTGHRDPELNEDGQRVPAVRSGRGFPVDPVTWDDETVDRTGYEAAVVRSCWNYPDDVERFRALLVELDEANVTVCNPLEAYDEIIGPDAVAEILK